MKLTDEQIANTKVILTGLRGRDVSAMDMSRLYYAEYHESIDWHEFSQLLERLAVQAFVMLTGFTGARMRLYRHVGELHPLNLAKES